MPSIHLNAIILENIRFTNLPPAIIAVMATAALTAANPRASAIA
jgi:hypothetical protein